MLNGRDGAKALVICTFSRSGLVLYEPGHSLFDLLFRVANE